MIPLTYTRPGGETPVGHGSRAPGLPTLPAPIQACSFLQSLPFPHPSKPNLQHERSLPSTNYSGSQAAATKMFRLDQTFQEMLDSKDAWACWHPSSSFDCTSQSCPTCSFIEFPLNLPGAKCCLQHDGFPSVNQARGHQALTTSRWS